jgi:hypothetical protein
LQALGPEVPHEGVLVVVIEVVAVFVQIAQLSHQHLWTKQG